MNKIPTKTEVAMEERDDEMKRLKLENKAVKEVIANQEETIRELEVKLEAKPQSTRQAHVTGNITDDIEQQYEAARNALLAKQLELQGLQIKYKKMEDQLKDCETNSLVGIPLADISALRSKLSDSESRLEKVQEELTASRICEEKNREEIDRFIEHNVSMQQNIETLSTKLFERERESSKLKAELEILKTRADRSDELSKQLVEVTSKYDTEEAEFEAKLGKLANLEEMATEHAKALEKLEEVSAEAASLRLEVKRYREKDSAYELAERELEQTRQALQNAKGELEHLEQENVSLHDKMQNSASEMKRREQEQHAVVSKSEEKLLELLNTLSGLKANLESEKQHSEELMKQIKQLEASLCEKTGSIQIITRQNADANIMLKIVSKWAREIGDNVQQKQEMQAYIDFLDHGRAELAKISANTHLGELQLIFESFSDICNGLIM